MVKILLGQIRYDRHMTLLQLSKLSGISNAHICDIENGKSVPTINVLCAIARGLQVPVTDLFIDTKGKKEESIERSKCDTCICYRAFLKNDAMNNELYGNEQSGY